MFVLVDNNNVCCFTGDTIEYGIFDEPIHKWRVTNNVCMFYVVGDYFTKSEVENVPEDYTERKYCYTDEKGFYINPFYAEPINTEEEVKRLTQENIDLKAQLDKVQEVLDYLVMQ